MNDSKLCSTVYKKLALCALLTLPYVNNAQAQQDSNKVADKIIGNEPALSRVEAAIKQQKELEGDSLKMNAEEAMRGGNLSEAVDKFTAAINTYKKVSSSEPRIISKIKDASNNLSSIYKKFAVQLIAEADKNLSVDQFDEAMETLERALAFNPDLDKFVSEQKRKIIDLRKDAERVAAVNAKGLEKEFKQIESEKSWRFEQAQILFSNRRFIDARDMLEEILVLDPFDTHASTLLLRVNESLFKSGRSRRIATIQERVDEVEWKWNLPIKSASAGLSSELNDEGAVPNTSEYDKITEKLKIVIPRFRQNAKIQDVIDALKEESIKQDVDRKGLTLIYRPFTGDGVEEAAPQEDAGFDAFEEAEDDPFAEPDALSDAPEEVVSSGTDKKFNFDFENMPIGEIIRYICIAAGLKYKVDDHAVIIADHRVRIDEMVTRFYPVNSQVFSAIKDTAGGDGGGDLVGGIGDIAGEDEGDVKQYLEAMGVQFPAGSSIAYLPNVSRLVVNNTVTEQRRIQEIINQLQVDAAQIIIETKFIEVNQSDLEEFGFQWALQETAAINETVNLLPNLENNTNINTNSGYGPVTTTDGNINFIDGVTSGVGALNEVTGGLGSGIRSASELLSGVAMNGLGILNSEASKGFASFTSVLGDNQFNTVIRALSQQTNADILSAPKVITQNGNTAILRVVTERYFPETWEPPTIDVSGNGGGGNNGGAALITVQPSMPQFGEPTDLGVVLEVTPQVDPDGVSIELELKPQVVEFIALDDTFNSVVITAQVDVATNTLITTYVPSRFDMPILSTRTVDTRIKMWDGESVVIGGLLKEKVISWNDSVPYLSDIPLLGAMFRNEGDARIKQNLLIFVSARLVNNAGLPIRENNIRGLPDFKRL